MNNTPGLIARLAMAQTARNTTRDSEASSRRLARDIDEQLMDEFDKNATLTLANRKLKEENALALELIRILANRSETFRRVARHLRLAWQSLDPAEAHFKDDASALVRIKEQELLQDPTWQQQRDAGIQRKLTELAELARKK